MFFFSLLYLGSARSRWNWTEKWLNRKEKEEKFQQTANDKLFTFPFGNSANWKETKKKCIVDYRRSCQARVQNRFQYLINVGVFFHSHRNLTFCRDLCSCCCRQWIIKFGFTAQWLFTARTTHTLCLHRTQMLIFFYAIESSPGKSTKLELFFRSLRLFPSSQRLARSYAHAHASNEVSTICNTIQSESRVIVTTSSAAIYGRTTFWEVESSASTTRFSIELSFFLFLGQKRQKTKFSFRQSLFFVCTAKSMSDTETKKNQTKNTSAMT